MAAEHDTGPNVEPYAEPRVVTDLDDCLFYHTMDVPGHGLVEGQWDLRPGITDYLGGVDFGGKRVLELGTASGFVCFHLEHQGADVVAYDLSDRHDWDIVPFPWVDVADIQVTRRSIMRRINNAWWLCHRASGSRARVVYGSVYDVPAAIGAVDVATYCSVLLHLRDPFQALASGLRLTRETAVVTEITPEGPGGTGEPGRPYMEFMPDYRCGDPIDAWWYLNPGIVQSWLGVLGFDDSRVSWHTQTGPVAGTRRFFTVVGHRTKGAAEGE